VTKRFNDESKELGEHNFEYDFDDPLRQHGDPPPVTVRSLPSLTHIVPGTRADSVTLW